MSENLRVKVEKNVSYDKWAIYYDAIYEAQGKNYKKESDQIHTIIEQYKKSEGNTLLDVGCGTGGHFPFLKEWYSLEGLDIDADMLKIASKRFPNTNFHQADMTDFNLEKEFDVVTCLFSAIGYTKTLDKLGSSISNMAKHTKQGGIVIVEPWFSPDQWKEGNPHVVFVDKPDLKITRANIAERDGNISIINFHFLVAEPSGVKHFTQYHEMGLFTNDQYMKAFKNAGLETNYDAHGLTGRGLYIGIKSLTEAS